jgi:dolichol-phosphate mannosyltransferase
MMTNRDLPGKISVIMPAFNEQEVIQHSIRETAKALAGCDYEIIIVDDGSSDSTYEQAQKSALSNERVKVFRYENNQGKGWALRYGFDLELPPYQIWTLWDVMKETETDVVIGSKWHPDARVDYPWQRRVTSAIYFCMLKWLFGLPLHDTITGLKLFRRQVLQKAFPRMKVKRFAFDVELLVIASRFGYHIAEAPVTIHFQRGKMGRMGASAILRMIRDTLDVFYRASFWKWLSPGLATRVWMFAFIIGLESVAFSVTHLLLRIRFPGILSQLAWYVSLKFIPSPWRFWIILAAGLIVTVMSLVQLNKSLLSAFARFDGGDIAGIANTRLVEQGRKMDIGKGGLPRSPVLNTVAITGRWPRRSGDSDT